jgi:multidrug efflux pump subunit AcrA (membrane-fusion protein)
LKWLLAGAVVLAAALYLGRNLILGSPVRTVTAVRAPLVQTVVASGRIITPQRVAIGATITERVARIPVDEGQTVKKGEVLIALDDSDERAALAQAQSALVQAEAKMRQMRELTLPATEQALAQAQANAVQARLSYERTEALRKQGFVGQAQLDDARRALDVAGPRFALRGDANKAVSITGIDTATYVRVIGLADKIVAGRLLLGTSDIVIGIELAKDLGAGVGDKLRLTTAGGAAETLTVAALFDFGNKGVNERNVYIALRTAQNLLDLVGGVSSIEIKVEDPFAAETIAQDIQAQTGLEAASWIKTNAQFFTAMAAQSLSNTLIRFFVGLTAALGIASVLVVSVVQKSKEIGILRAMGVSRGQVLRVFLLQGAFMGWSDRSSAAAWAGRSSSPGAAWRATRTARRSSSSSSSRSCSSRRRSARPWSARSPR